MHAAWLCFYFAQTGKWNPLPRRMPMSLFERTGKGHVQHCSNLGLLFNPLALSEDNRKVCRRLRLVSSGHSKARWPMQCLQYGLIKNTLEFEQSCCCRYAEAVKECSRALEFSAGYHKALVRRGKAYEQMGHYKQALSDLQKANKTESATPESQVLPSILESPSFFRPFHLGRARVQTCLPVPWTSVFENQKLIGQMSDDSLWLARVYNMYSFVL